MSDHASIARYIRFVDAPDPASLGATVHEFLAWLGGPTLIRIPGRDGSRVRGVSTLLHGNEQSGIVAAHQLLRSGEQPAVDMLYFFGSVEAAMEPPGFANRMLPGRLDLNRCFFPPFKGREGRIAQELLFLLRECEALVDVHNNSGKNPAYGIVTRLDPEHIGLVSLFAPQCIFSDLSLGSLTEATEGLFTSVTIECGRAGDPAADDVAFAGLKRYTESASLAAVAQGPVAIYECPIRVCLADGIHVVFSEQPSHSHDLTLSPDLEQHNFEQLPAGTHIGYVLDGAPWPFEVRAADGEDCSRDYFEVVDSELRLKADVVPTMMTCDARLAAADCLCYLVQSKQS